VGPWPPPWPRAVEIKTEVTDSGRDETRMMKLPLDRRVSENPNRLRCGRHTSAQETQAVATVKTEVGAEPAVLAGPIDRIREQKPNSGSTLTVVK
jgi:hypothetical protein